jgi:hypothetical protein
MAKYDEIVDAQGKQGDHGAKLQNSGAKITADERATMEPSSESGAKLRSGKSHREMP